MDDALIAANKEIARRFFEHFERGDVAATIALFAPDATYFMPAIRRDFNMTEFEEGLHWILSRLKSGIRFKLSPAVAEGGRVCIMAEGFAETTEGKPYNNRYHVYFEILDGKIVRAREYNDTALVFATLRAKAAE